MSDVHRKVGIFDVRYAMLIVAKFSCIKFIKLEEFLSRSTLLIQFGLEVNAFAFDVMTIYVDKLSVFGCEIAYCSHGCVQVLGNF